MQIDLLFKIAAWACWVTVIASVLTHTGGRKWLC